MAGIGWNTKYEIDTGSGYVEIAEVINITPGESTAERVEVTHMRSADRRREYIAGLIDNGEATFEINWNPGDDTDVILRTLFTSGDVKNHRITFPNGVTLVYEAALTGYTKVIPIDDRMTATITVAVSGDETWGTAS